MPQHSYVISRKLSHVDAAGEHTLHLLPYHRLGEGKYEGLGRNYDLKGILPLDNERMQVLLEAARPFGIRCQIGG